MANKVFTYHPEARCHYCDDVAPLRWFAVLTVESANPSLQFFLAFHQFCSEVCLHHYVAELNTIHLGLETYFKYEITEGKVC